MNKTEINNVIGSIQEVVEALDARLGIKASRIVQRTARTVMFVNQLIQAVDLPENIMQFIHNEILTPVILNALDLLDVVRPGSSSKIYADEIKHFCNRLEDGVTRVKDSL